MKAKRMVLGKKKPNRMLKKLYQTPAERAKQTRPCPQCATHSKNKDRNIIKCVKCYVTWCWICCGVSACLANYNDPRVWVNRTEAQCLYPKVHASL